MNKKNVFNFEKSDFLLLYEMIDKELEKTQLLINHQYNHSYILKKDYEFTFELFQRYVASTYIQNIIKLAVHKENKDTKKFNFLRNYMNLMNINIGELLFVKPAPDPDLPILISDELNLVMDRMVYRMLNWDEVIKNHQKEIKRKQKS